MSDIFKLILFMVVIPLASIYVYEDEKFEWEQFMKLCGIMISNRKKMEHARSGKEAQDP